MPKLRRAVAAGCCMASLHAPASALALPTGTYRPTGGGVSCGWEPRGDYVACATPAMARRGAYVFIDSLNGVGRTEGEVIRGGRRVRPGVEMDSGSITCTWGRTSVRCENSEAGFKLGAGVNRLWGSRAGWE